MGVEIHFLGGSGRSFFAEVDEVVFAVGGAEQEKSAAAQISGLRMDDGESEAGGDGGIDSVTASAHDFDSGLGCQFVNADNDGVRGVGGAEGRGEGDSGGDRDDD